MLPTPLYDAPLIFSDLPPSSPPAHYHGRSRPAPAPVPSSAMSPTPFSFSFPTLGPSSVQPPVAVPRHAPSSFLPFSRSSANRARVTQFRRRGLEGEGGGGGAIRMRGDRRVRQQQKGDRDRDRDRVKLRDVHSGPRRRLPTRPLPLPLSLDVSGERVLARRRRWEDRRRELRELVCEQQRARARFARPGTAGCCMDVASAAAPIRTRTGTRTRTRGGFRVRVPSYLFALRKSEENLENNHRGIVVGSVPAGEEENLLRPTSTSAVGCVSRFYGNGHFGAAEGRRRHRKQERLRLIVNGRPSTSTSSSFASSWKSAHQYQSRRGGGVEKKSGVGIAKKKRKKKNPKKVKKTRKSKKTKKKKISVEDVEEESEAESGKPPKTMEEQVDDVTCAADGGVIMRSLFRKMRLHQRSKGDLEVGPECESEPTVSEDDEHQPRHRQHLDRSFPYHQYRRILEEQEKIRAERISVISPRRSARLLPRPLKRFKGCIAGNRLPALFARFPTISDNVLLSSSSSSQKKRKMRRGVRGGKRCRSALVGRNQRQQRQRRKVGHLPRKKSRRGYRESDQRNGNPGHGSRGGESHVHLLYEAHRTSPSGKKDLLVSYCLKRPLLVS